MCVEQNDFLSTFSIYLLLRGMFGKPETEQLLWKCLCSVELSKISNSIVRKFLHRLRSLCIEARFSQLKFSEPDQNHTIRGLRKNVTDINKKTAEFRQSETWKKCISIFTIWNATFWTSLWRIRGIWRAYRWAIVVWWELRTICRHIAEVRQLQHLRKLQITSEVLVVQIYCTCSQSAFRISFSHRNY